MILLAGTLVTIVNGGIFGFGFFCFVSVVRCGQSPLAHGQTVLEILYSL
jgi:hypothetical protein